MNLISFEFSESWHFTSDFLIVTIVCSVIFQEICNILRLTADAAAWQMASPGLSPAAASFR